MSHPVDTTPSDTEATPAEQLSHAELLAAIMDRTDEAISEIAQMVGTAERQLVALRAGLREALRIPTGAYLDDATTLTLVKGLVHSIAADVTEAEVTAAVLARQACRATPPGRRP